jgi:hypothetical protein
MVHSAIGLFVPSRQKLSSDYFRILDQASANLKLPMREADWTGIEHDLKSSHDSLFSRMNPMAIARFTPSFWFAQDRADINLSRRDGLVVGIALEAYRREHGSYPQELKALVPGFVARIPEDRFTGGELKYRLLDGKPLVYSVGTDRDDDGGRAPQSTYKAAGWEVPDAPTPDGDWLLYPTKP